MPLRLSSWVLAAAAGASLAFGSMPAAGGAELQEVRFEPSSAELLNPERGFCIQLDTRKRLQPIEPAQFQRARSTGVTLVNRIFYLKDFRDRWLTDRALATIEQDFAAAREHGVKLVPRFAYSSRIGEADASEDVVLRHIRQLKPLLTKNSDVILTLQAGFIGAWGEWHASTNGLDSAGPMRRVAMGLLDALPPDRCIQVRTPKAKQQVVQRPRPLNADRAFDGSPAARIGHHNDCFVADETDVGTYRDDQAAEDREFVATETCFLPMGGETCRNSEYAGGARALRELSAMHWTYLNRSYHRGVLRRWQEQGALTEVRDRLGYRLSITSVQLSKSVAAGGQLRGKIVLINLGWAAPVNPRPLELILANADTEQRFTLPTEVRTWLPGEPIVVEFDLSLDSQLETGAYHALLSLPDPAPKLRDDPRYAIRLANDDLWEPETGRHLLPVTVGIGR
ncbi:hypothetical protein Pla123a_12110 [Posidoniimonas polymericola]|uniref:DUF4832 domain-containing protein n=1 Tax=Posidoniimonas polymericola TaxID=2528002 RepID=A0A5C5YTU6_9BACT|nr:DUF4832 domain-containing protein [Posidoniimonas polymericola]TWT78419.1 hypothetical protein Pla123a_12110 [Posidoniimonas polymericola]